MNAYRLEEDMRKIILRIGGMSCSACSGGLQKYLNKQKGVINASVNLVMASASVEYNDDEIDIDDLAKYVENAAKAAAFHFNTFRQNPQGRSCLCFCL